MLDQRWNTIVGKALNMIPGWRRTPRQDPALWQADGVQAHHSASASSSGGRRNRLKAKAELIILGDFLDWPWLKGCVSGSVPMARSEPVRDRQPSQQCWVGSAAGSYLADWPADEDGRHGSVKDTLKLERARHAGMRLDQHRADNGSLERHRDGDVRRLVPVHVAGGIPASADTVLAAPRIVAAAARSVDIAAASRRACRSPPRCISLPPSAVPLLPAPCCARRKRSCRGSRSSARPPRTCARTGSQGLPPAASRT